MALFAGTVALMALTTTSRAQTAGDALIDKLEQKGILTSEEAKDLREENSQDFAGNFTNSFDSAFSKKTGMPDWVTDYKLSGDFRGRFEDFTSDNPNFVDRIRFRYRLRAGLTVDMKDNLQVGFRLGTGDPVTGFGTQTGNPLSNNSSFQDNGTKKFVYIDTAYGKWTPLSGGDWTLSTIFGKMDNPFQFTPMVFDSDLTPEGGAAQGSYKINDSHSISFVGAAFILDEEKASSQDPFLYGGQMVWNAKWSPKWTSSLGAGAFNIVNDKMLTTANVPYVNQGNTRTAGGTLVKDYNPLIADASVTYTLETFPFYNGAFPVRLAAEYMENPGASGNNRGYWGGVTFGKSGKKQTWDLLYRYEYLEADAWYDQLVDDDNGAYYQTAPTGAPLGSAFSGTSYGWFGGTNIKGHLVKFNYSITDSLTFSMTCFINDLINPGLNAPLGEPQSHAIHAFADLMWKF